MIRRTTAETRFSGKNLVSILLISLIMSTACSPPTPSTPIPLTPTARLPDPIPTFLALPVLHEPPAPLPTSRSLPEPATVLLLGVDRRNPGSSVNVNNTDTLMLLHLDPNARRFVILSIPRDLYVEIPGHQQGRINTAYTLGEQDGTGGLDLARRTVSNTLGIPVQSAVLLDFHAFAALVDAIGGVDVDVPYAISDLTYPDNGIGYAPFYLPAGQQYLDGATALKYARTRATPGGDFDRTARQRQLALAVRDRVTRLDLLPGLVAQSPQLWTVLQSAFETDLTLAEMIDLAVSAARVPTDQIITASIDQTCTHFWATPDGAQVLVSDPVAIETLLADLFPPSPTTTAVTN